MSQELALATCIARILGLIVLRRSSSLSSLFSLSETLYRPLIKTSISWLKSTQFSLRVFIDPNACEKREESNKYFSDESGFTSIKPKI